MSGGPVTVGFAGLSHLGIVSAAAAARGFPVVAWDPDPALADALARGDLPVLEPGLPALLQAYGDRLRFTADRRDLAAADLVFVAADVPTDAANASDLGPIRALLDAVMPALRPDAVLTVLSQVPPGFTRSLAWPAPRRFCQVETLVFGRAVERATRPERFIVGAADPAAALPPAYAAFLAAFGCPVLPMRYESAELAKVAINLCLIATLTATNALAELAEALGADWREVAPALRLDRRIGRHAYLTPGLGIAGGNLERDLVTVTALAAAHGTDDGFFRAAAASSRHRRDWVLARLHEHVLGRTADPLLAVLGLAYKEDTRSTRNSPALALLEALHPFRVRLYDPAVPAAAAGHPRATAAADALEACDGADAVAILTPWREFRILDPRDLVRRLRRPLAVDPFGMLDPAACRACGLTHLVLGAGALPAEEV